MTRVRLLLCLASAVWSCMGSLPAVAQTKGAGFAVVMSGRVDELDRRMVEGAKAYFGRVNAVGGVGGRQLRLVLTPDDDGSDESYAQALRSAVAAERAVAIVGCTSDETCRQAAKVSAELGVPLIASLSGRSDLSRPLQRNVFRIRPGHAKEAQVLARQLKRLAVTKAVLVTDKAADAESDKLLARALSDEGIESRLIAIRDAAPSNLAAAVKQITGGGFHAAVMNVKAPLVEAIINQELSDSEPWPRVLMTLSNGSISAYQGQFFKGSVVGFTQLVPNPEIPNHALVREFDQDATKYAGFRAVTLEGMEAYVGACLLVQALERSLPTPTPQRLISVLTATDEWNVKGFRLSFAHGRDSGSDWIELGLRGRTGVLVR